MFDLSLAMGRERSQCRMCRQYFDVFCFTSCKMVAARHFGAKKLKDSGL